MVKPLPRVLSASDPTLSGLYAYVADCVHHMPKRRREREREVEPDFERQPRRPAGEDEPEERLPVKATDGKWKRVQGERKPRRPEPASEGDNEVGVEPGEPSQKELERVARQVENDAATTAANKLKVAQLGRQIVEAPQKHVGLLRDLLDMAKRDRSPVVQRLALLSIVSALVDLMPAYRIRPPTDKEMAMQVSREVELLRQFEKTLLQAYEECVATLKRWLGGSLEAHRTAAVRGLIALLRKGYDFNFRDEVIAALVPVGNWAEDTLAAEVCAALRELFESDSQGEATLSAVKQMATLLKSSSFNVRVDLVSTWLSLQLDGAQLSAPANKKVKRKRAGLDPVAKELAAAAGERGNRGRMQAQILEHVFVSYARVVKKGTHSPLLPVVLKGIAAWAHQVNLELLLDLFSHLRALLVQEDEGGLSPASALHCVHALLRLLSGHGQALQVDTKDVQLKLYSLLLSPAVLADAQLLSVALDCLEHLCRKSRAALLAPRVASFVRRLLSLACVAPHAQAVALLCVVSRLVVACPRVATMLEPAEAGGALPTAGLADAGADDPDTHGALRTTAWHLTLLQQHYHPTVRELAAKLAAQELMPARLNSATPLQIINNYTDATGAFAPPPPVPKPHRLSLLKPDAPPSSYRLGATPSCSISDVREAASESLAAVGSAGEASFRELYVAAR